MKFLNSSYSQCIYPGCETMPTVVIQGIADPHKRSFTVQALSCMKKEHKDYGFGRVQEIMHPYVPDVIDTPPNWLLKRQEREVQKSNQHKDEGGKRGDQPAAEEEIAMLRQHLNQRARR